jgi:hypothetical protein
VFALRNVSERKHDLRIRTGAGALQLVGQARVTLEQGSRALEHLGRFSAEDAIELGQRRGVVGVDLVVGRRVRSHAPDRRHGKRHVFADAAAFNAAWQEGRAMTLDQAVQYAMSAPAPLPDRQS